MKARAKNIEMQLREAIWNAPVNRHRLCKVAGVTDSQLSLFVNGKRSLTLTAAAKVAEALGLELVPKKSKKARGEAKQ